MIPHLSPFLALCLLATVDIAAAAIVAELATVMAPRPTVRVLGGVLLANLLFGVVSAWGLL